MNTVESKRKLNWQKALDTVRGVISSLYFPFITAAVTLVCYYLAWDMVTIWYMALCGTFILIFMKDTSPLITVFLFMNIMISMENSPTLIGGNPDEYYFQTAILAQIGVAIGLFACAGIYRMVTDIRARRFKVSPTFFGLCAFAVGIMFNGLFSEGYTPMNAVYGFFMAFLFLGLFVICSGSITINPRTYERIAWSFIALSLCLIIELAVAYGTYEGLWLESGGIDRDKLYFGWGMYNTIGMLFVISMPSAAYLAQKYRHGLIFTIYLVALVLCAFLSMSRQSMLCGAVVFVICAVWIMIKCSQKWVNGGIFVATAVAAVIALVVNRAFVDEVFAMLTENFFSGSGRTTLYEKALATFMEYPVFGSGFYHDLSEDPGFVGLPIIPDMYHNTVFELMAVGGLFAIVPYVIHRIHTVISFVKNPSQDRFFVGLTIFALLILSLLDNHIFYILPTIVYSFMTAVLINSEKSRSSAA